MKPTCVEDLTDDPEFKGFLLCWQRDKRCPLALADWLRERDLHQQAEVAEWAAWVEGKPSFNRTRDGDGLFGPTPLKIARGWEWLGVTSSTSPDNRTEHDCLIGLPTSHPCRRYGTTFTQAIVAFLDHYRVEWANERAPTA